MPVDIAPPAKLLLDLIASVEAGPTDQYNVVYGHHEKSLTKPITAMTLTELLGNQMNWGKIWGSSAAGRYQIMPATLKGLEVDLGLTGAELFTPALQDQLGWRLLVRRGYSAFVAKKISTVDFGKALAQEWASFPVLAACTGAHRQIGRGECYYAGDKLNKALLAPEKVEAALAQMLALTASPAPMAPAPGTPLDHSAPPAKPALKGFSALLAFIVQFLLTLIKRHK